MKNKKINEVVVAKPWGKEHCIYENENLAIWHLTIMPSEKTSLHCHPNKKTALILLDGKAQINLVERSFHLIGLSKVMLRQGMFHQTVNISEKPITLIEVETPNDKFDLIRIADDYGRKSQSFESSDLWTKKTSKEKNITKGKKQTINGLDFKIQKLKKVIKSNYPDDCVVVILGKYGFFTQDNKILCESGEALTFKIVKFLSERFMVNNEEEVLIICKSN